jgi:2-phosphoglycerate kinase
VHSTVVLKVPECDLQCIRDGKSFIIEGLHLDPGRCAQHIVQQVHLGFCLASDICAHVLHLR